MPKRYVEYESMSSSLLTSSTAGIDGPILRRDRVWVQSFHIKHCPGHFVSRLLFLEGRWYHSADSAGHRRTRSRNHPDS